MAAVFAITTPFLSPALRKICLPFVPATETQIKNIFEALGSQKGKLIDLGSGDGRIVIEAAKKNYQSVGVELNFWLVLYSKFKSLYAGTYNQTTFRRENIFKHNLSSYDNIIIFGVDSLMEPLQTKLIKEMKNDATVVACRFPFKGNTQPFTHGCGIDTVWKYKKYNLIKS